MQLPNQEDETKKALAATTDVVRRLYDRNCFAPTESGYLQFWPSNDRYYEPYILRDIADFVDAANKAWDDFIDWDFTRMKEQNDTK